MQLVLTIAGSVVGGAIGGPVGASIGAAIGSYIGGVVLADDPPDIVGPRLDDRRVQISSYGVNIPRNYGGGRVAGNVIWAADLEEQSTTNEVGGKGGPTQTTTTYSYYASFATLLAFGRQRGIRRIFADAVLIYDATQPSISLDFEAAFYPGSETQLPDPTMEAALGVGQVPAYRGFCYLVFTSLPLERFGNRIPSISVELMGDGEWESTGTDLDQAQLPLTGVSGGTYWGSYIMGAAKRADGQIVYVTYPNATSPAATTGIKLWVIDGDTGAPVLSMAHPTIDVHYQTINVDLLTYVPALDEIWLGAGDALVHRFNAETLAFVSSIQLAGGYSPVEWEPTTRRVFFRPNASWLCAGGRAVVLAAGSSQVDVLRLYGPDGQVTLTDAGTIDLEGQINYESMDAIIDTIPDSDPNDDPAQSGGACFDPTRHRYVYYSGRIWTITDVDPPVLTAHAMPGGSQVGIFRSITYDATTDSIIILSVIGTGVMCTILDAEDFSLLWQSDNGPSYWIDGDHDMSARFAFLAQPGSLTVLGYYAPWRLDYFGTTVAAAVRALSIASGLTDADIDVTEIGMRLRGFLVAEGGAARGPIAQLAQAFFFEGVEQDDRIYFRRRGGAVVATIPADECGAGVDQAAERAITKNRAQELNLPAHLAVTASDPYTDYQPGTQYAERLAVDAGDDESVQFAVVFSIDEIKQLAEAMIFDRWASRERWSFATTRKYARLIPSDPVLLGADRFRIVSRSDEGGLIRFEAVADDPDVITQTMSGVQGTFPGQHPTVAVPTIFVPLDIPLLRDDDDAAGFYGAAYGVAPYWRGGVVMQSPDLGVSFERAATFARPGSSMGSALSALGDFDGGHVFDETNALAVSMNNGAPSSLTSDALIAGGNYLAIAGTDGWEILQYRDATLQVDGTYLLTGLLRGRQGSEYAMGGHAVGDRVALLSAATLRNIAITNAQIGSALVYKAVSIGDTVAATPVQGVTSDAERLKPWAPVDFRIARAPGGDCTLSWKRRTRLACRFTGPLGINVPLGEASEEYEVDISYLGTLVRSFAGLTSPQVAYSLAMQTADGLAPNALICVAIYQISATVGRGHPLEVCKRTGLAVGE